MKLFLEKPHDLLITERIQVLGGRVEGVQEPFSLKASCQGQEITFRQSFQANVQRSQVVRFWGYVILQELIPVIDGKFFEVDFTWDGRPLETAWLRLSPSAIELAESYPLNRRCYRVTEGTADSRIHTIVFPGLGGVGGASLSALMRFMMHRWNYPVPVENEPDDPHIWRGLLRRDPPAPRWIDGHHCYSAAAELKRPFARITLLRDPIKRMASIFNYCSIVHPSRFPYATFQDFIASEDAPTFTQAAGLLRCAGLAIPSLQNHDQLYSMARRELEESYSIAGITELFEETIFAICNLAGYSEIGMWWSVLAAPQTSNTGDLPTAAAKRLRKVVAVDLQLYEDARSRFLQTWVEADFGADFQEYKKDAAAQPRLPDSYKRIECLRWRQILEEEQVGRLWAVQATRRLLNRVATWVSH